MHCTFSKYNCRPLWSLVNLTWATIASEGHIDIHIFHPLSNMVNKKVSTLTNNSTDEEDIMEEMCFVIDNSLH